MKISIIGAGNVGSLAAMRIAEQNLGDITLVDAVKGLAQGKAFDLEDARSILKNDYQIEGTDDINKIKGSDIIVITAGVPRKPGMSREELLNKNARIIKDISLNIKKLASSSIILVVTNPLDLMTYFVLKITGFNRSKVFGMGISLDAARFSNLINKELNIPNTDVEPCVISSHGEGMLPLPRFSSIKGRALDEFLDDKKIGALVAKTLNRGAQIVSLLGSGSAFFAPSCAIAEIIKIIAKDEKRTVGICACLNGEYGLKDVCIGVPARLGRNGIEKIVELELNKKEKDSFSKSAENIRQLIKQLPF